MQISNKETKHNKNDDFKIHLPTLNTINVPGECCASRKACLKVPGPLETKT